MQGAAEFAVVYGFFPLAAVGSDVFIDLAVVVGIVLFIVLLYPKAAAWIGVVIKMGKQLGNVVEAEIDVIEGGVRSLTLQDGKQLRVVLPLPCLLQLPQEDSGFERGKGGLGAAVLIVVRGRFGERVGLFRGSGRGVAVVVRGGFSERVGLAGFIRADAVRIAIVSGDRRLARCPARGAAGFVAVIFVVGAQAQGFFVSGADAAKACRVAVRTVLADECRVGGLDGGFVAGRRDAKGLPAVHSRSG